MVAEIPPLPLPPTLPSPDAGGGRGGVGEEEPTTDVRGTSRLRTAPGTPRRSQPQRGRGTSTGKRLVERRLSVAVDRPAEGPSAPPANRWQRDADADRSGPHPLLGEDLPEANST